MAYTDNLDDLWGLPKLQAQKEAATSLVKEYLQVVTDASKQIRGLQMGFISPESLQKAQQLSAQAEKLTKDQIKNIELLAKARLAEAKADEAQSKAAMTARREKWQVEKDDLLLQKQLEAQAKANTKVLEAHAKALQKAELEAKKVNNEYEVMKRQYKALADEAKRLGAAHGIESTQFKNAAASAHALHTQLLNIEMSVGQAQRQVGNYNLVGAQFNQLLREAPNFAVSMRTGIMALTNNMTYFMESIKAARKEGQTYMQIIKSMGNSLFGMVGIMNIAILAITYFSLKAASAESATSKAEAATKRYKDALNEAGRSANRSAMEEQSRLEILNRVATDTTKSTKARNEAVKEMQKLYPDYLANYTAEAIKAGEAAGAIDLITEAILKRAAATAAEKRVIASGEKILDLQQAQAKAVAEQSKAYNQLSNAQKAASASTVQTGTVPSSGNQLLAVYELRAAMAEKNLKEITKAIADEKALQKQFATLAVQAAGESLDLNKDTPTGTDTKATTATVEKRLEDISKVQFEAQKEQLEAEIQVQKSISENEDLSYQERSDAIERFYYLKKQLIEEAAEYEKMVGNKTAIQAQAIEEQSQAEIFKLSQQTLDMEAKAWDDKIKKEIEAAALTEKLQKDNADRVIKNSELSAKLDKEELKRKMDFVSQVAKSAQQAYAIYTKLADDRSQRELAELDRQQEEVQNTEIRQRDAAMRSVGTTEEKEAAILKIESEADDKRQQINDRRKREEIEAANRQKQLALVGVISNMIIGISKEIASKGVAGLATSAAIGVYIATLTGTIAALSVPAYAEGTDEGGHKGGAALIGERYEAERVTEPSGKTYWVNKPTLFKNLPKGTEVVPLHKMNADSLDMSSMNMANSIMLQVGGSSAKTERLLSQAVSKLDKISNKPTEKTIIKDGSMFKTVTQGSIKHNYLRKNFLD